MGGSWVKGTWDLSALCLQVPRNPSLFLNKRPSGPRRDRRPGGFHGEGKSSPVWDWKPGRMGPLRLLEEHGGTGVSGQEPVRKPVVVSKGNGWEAT